MWFNGNYLLFTEVIHLIVTLLIVVWFWSRFPKVSRLYSLLVGLLFGFLVDGDHMLEYLIYIFNSDQSFSIGGFLGLDYFKYNGMIMVLGHAWEWSAVLLGIYWVNRDNKKVWPKYVLLAGVALAGHLVMDQITNFSSPLFYFLSYRLTNGFGLGI